MNFFYISGTSRGIGKALAEKLLENEENFVYGISRNNFILHDRYEHIRLDLSDLESVKSFHFYQHKRAKKVVLINNAAILGEIYPIGDLNNEDIINTFNINLLSVSVLMNKFIHTYSKTIEAKQILNISSGAGRHPVVSWSIYCSSKSALDMLSEVTQIDSESKNFKIWSIAPGIVDTDMQEQIRSTKRENFPERNKFVNYKENNLLSFPKKVAEQLIFVLNNPQKFPQVILDVRNFA